MRREWPTKPLQSLCEDVNVGHVGPSSMHRDPKGIAFLMGKNVGTGVIYTHNVERVTEAFHHSQPKSRLRPGDIVVVRIGKSGQAAKVPEGFGEANCSGLVVIKQPHGIHPDFLVYYLNSPIGRGYSLSQARGSTRLTLNTSSVAETLVPVPPMAEQQRIVGVLDEAFTGLAIAQATAEKNYHNARALFESHLQSVFTQRGNGWVEKTCEDVCQKITDGTHHSPKTQFNERAPGTFPYITSKNIRNNFMDLSNVAYIEQAFHEEVYARCQPSLGDVLLTKDGANTGNVTLNTLDEPFSLLSSVCLIKTNPTMLRPAFLCYYLQSATGLSSIVGQMTGAAIKRIVLKDIKKAVIPFPALKEQDSIVTKLNSLLEATQRLAQVYERKVAALAALKKSLLHQAFTGNL